MHLIVRPEAEADLQQAFDWYEEQRPGLGLEFMDEVDRCLEFISQRPQSFAVAAAPARRAVVRRFPYTIFFVPGERAISVIAAFHMARNPEALSIRLGPVA